MPAPNFYVVLGVPPTETSAGIRQAFRELALRYHPDRAGVRATPFFQEIVHAYRVLSDPARRASYDEGLRHARELQVIRRAPITVEADGDTRTLARLSLFHDFEVTRPPLEDVFDRFVRSFTDPWPWKSTRVDALDLELLLSSDEAARGGVVALGVPVFYPCRRCHGGGHVGSFACDACGGRGLATEEEEVRVVVPGLVRDGTVLRVPLRGLGIHNLQLEILVRVGA